jgi:hypothetical protein
MKLTKLQNFISSKYGYEITLEQAKQIEELLDTYSYGDRYTFDEIEEVTDYILYGEKSVFAENFK